LAQLRTNILKENQVLLLLLLLANQFVKKQVFNRLRRV
jgi:hypothetical protein